MYKYHVYDNYNKVLFYSDKLLYAHLFITLKSNKCKLYKNNKLDSLYYLGNEIDEDKLKEKIIKDFLKKLEYFSSDSYYTKDDFPKELKKIINYIITEIDYWISCCYENGHALNDELNNPDYKKIVIKQIKKIKELKNILEKII